jgi:predicted nucleic acid-binding protein
VLRELAEDKLRLNISVSVALEYEDVLKRPGLVIGFTESQVDQFLDFIFSVSARWASVPRLRPSLRDPDDERILEVAVQSRSRIVTHNVRDFEGAAQLVNEIRRRDI